MMHHSNTVDQPRHQSHRTMAASLETTDSGRILTPTDSGEYDNLYDGPQSDTGTGADSSAPPPLPPQTTYQSSPSPMPQTEHDQTERAQCYAQGQRICPGHAQLHFSGALQASGTQGFNGNGYFRGQQHSQDSKTKTAMQVYLESQQKDFSATQVDACSVNLSTGNGYVQQTAGKTILDQNRTDMAPGHVSSDTPDPYVQNVAPHTPSKATQVRHQYVIHLRKTHQSVVSSGFQHQILFQNCPGQVGATAENSNPHTDAVETDMYTPDQTRDYDPSKYQGGDEAPWSPAPPSDPRPDQSPFRRASGYRGIPREQFLHSRDYPIGQAHNRSQSSQGHFISSMGHNEQPRLAAEQQPVDAEPQYDFQRHACGVESPVRREYGYRREYDGRQLMRNQENVGDMATDLAQYTSKNPQCNILHPNDQAEPLGATLKLQTVHDEPQYDFKRDAEGGAAAERGNGYHEELLGGQEVHRPEHVRDIVSDQEHHKSQSAQCHITPSTDQKKQLHTEPMYDFIREENISSMEETGKPSTFQQNDIAAVMQGPSSTTDKNNVTKAPRTWICHCENVNLVGKDCLACQEKKVKGLQEPEKSNNTCIQESDDPAPASEVWQCKHCTYFNPMTERICEACAKSKDFLLEDTAHEIQEENHVEDDPEDGLDNTEKKCPECDFVNLAEAELCISCASELPNAKDKQLTEPAGGVEAVSQHGRRCQFCTYDNTIDAKICEMCSRTLDETSGAATRDRKEEPTYKTCKNCGKLIKITEDICFYCRNGSFVPGHVPAEQEQKQIRNEIDQNGKKPGVIQQVKSFFGFGKSRKEESVAVFYENDGLPCQQCTFRNSQNADLCEMCEIPIHKATPKETSMKPPDKIFISKGVSISGEAFVRYLKVGKEHGFQQGRVIWALRNCGAEGPICYLKRWLENRQRRENEAQAAQAVAHQATAYQHQYGPAGVVYYPVPTPIIYYPQYDVAMFPKETEL